MPANSDEQDFEASDARRSVGMRIVMVVLILVAIAMGSMVVLALLVPMMAGRRKRAQLELVKENMKQLGLALQNYNQTHGQPLQPVTANGKADTDE